VMLYVATRRPTRVIIDQGSIEPDFLCRIVIHSIINDEPIGCIAVCFGSPTQA
jgi:hypothetical protein